MSNSFWIIFNISSPLLPLTLFRSSEESAICCNSSNTNFGTISLPSINPVLHISAILPSIITLVSNFFGGLDLSSFLGFFSFIDVVNLPNLFILYKSSLLFNDTLIPIYPMNKYVRNANIPPTIGIEFIKPHTKYAITNPTISPIEPNNISV